MGYQIKACFVCEKPLDDPDGALPVNHPDKPWYSGHLKAGKVKVTVGYHDRCRGDLPAMPVGGCYGEWEAKYGIEADE